MLKRQFMIVSSSIVNIDVHPYIDIKMEEL